MIKRTRPEDLAPELVEPLRQTGVIISAYLDAMHHIVFDTGRDPKYADSHLLVYLSQDLLQSAISLVSLSMEGLLTVAKRELRFMLEASIKLCFVQQENYASKVAEKLCEFDKELSSQRISIKENLDLDMLPETDRSPFTEEVGRLYGLTSGYVHLTPGQIVERIAAIQAGRTAGFETPEDIAALNNLVSRVLAASLVLVFHSVPPYVAGDWLVRGDGSTVDSHFLGSRFLAGIDAHFDYKHERKSRLAEIAAARAARVRF
jgi:hypothetical protein